MKYKFFNLEERINEAIINSCEINFLDSIGMYLFGEPLPEPLLDKILENYSLNKINFNPYEAKRKCLIEAVELITKSNQ